MHLNFFYISWQTEPPKIAKKYQKLIEPFDFFFLKILAQILLLTLFSNRNMKKMKIPFWSEVKVVP